MDYEITGTLPSNFADYKEYYYVFTDTLSKGLTYNNDVQVKINDVDLTKYFYKNAAAAENGTIITVGIKDLKQLNNLTGVEVTASSTIVITYSATLNENAVPAGEGNKNDVVLEYSNNPNDSGTGTPGTPPEDPEKPVPNHPTGETPKSEVFTYTTELTILKNDSLGNVLTGAEFTLTGSGVNIVLVKTEEYTEDPDGEYWKLTNGSYTTTAPTITGGEDDNSADYADVDQKYSKSVSIEVKGANQASTNVKAEVGADGRVTFTGLGAGDYTITESKTPSGYNTIAPVNFTITFDAANKKFSSDNKDVTVGEDNMLDTTIVNEKGAELPSTGGTGTTIFYILGSILVIGAGVLLITRRRMSMEK